MDEKRTSERFFWGYLHSSSKIQFYFNKKVIGYWNQFLKNKKHTGLPVWQYVNIYYLDKLINENKNFS